MWEIQWGSEYETLVQIWNATGSKPKALQARPTIHDPNRLFLEAFYDLNAGRAVGESPQPITEVAIGWYADRILRVDSAAEFDKFYTLMRRADGAFLKHSVEKARRQLEVNRPRTGAPP